MSEWTGDELSALERAEEVQISSLQRDGTLGKPVTTWVVRAGDDLYVRSVKGRRGRWYRGVTEGHQGRIRAGGVEKDVTFVDPDGGLVEEIDGAYRTKYRRYAGAILDSVLTPDARSATLKVEPRSTR
jgi:hypothetical protein